MRKLLPAIAVVVLMPAPAAHAAFPGANGKIAFAKGGGIVVVEPDGSAQTRITPAVAGVTDRQPAWSPDGSRIALSRTVDHGANFDIYVMNADGTGANRVTSIGTLDQFPAWSPDGTRLVFTQAEGDSNCETIDCGDIVTVNVDGTDLRPVSDGDELDIEPAWSPDGKRIVFQRHPCLSVGCGADLVLIDPDGTDEAVLLDNDEFNRSPNWSPDGSRIAFNSTLDACCVGELYTINADGSGITQLTFRTPDRGLWFTSTDPAWSPDGARLAFTAGYGGTNAHEIHVSDAGGGNVQRLTTDSVNDFWPDWQPLNRAPSCAGVSPHPTELRPANRRFRRVAVSGATDLDGDPVAVEITGVTQDEPLTGPNDHTTSDARARPDAATVLLRAERDPQGDGRVYRLAVRALDGRGGSCEAEVIVEVRRHKHRPATDSAPPSFDSFGE